MEHLAITVLGPKEQNIYTKITELVTDMDCFISQVQGLSLGNENAFSALITGVWSNIAKLETALNTIAAQNDFTLLFKRTEKTISEVQMLAYNIQVISLDQIGVVYNVCNFFTSRSIYIDQLNAEAYISNTTSAPMLAVTLSISLPAYTNIAELREQFLIFCDDLNVDGILEPDKR